VTQAVAITGHAGASCLGTTLESHRAALASGRTGLRPLAEAGLPEAWADLSGGWIEPRSLLARRLYAPASQLAMHVARAAIADAGLDRADLRDAWLLVGSSRGNAAGWLEPWPGRRPSRLLAASNSMHGEIAAAVSIDLGIRGPYHVLANGCSAGLDALGWGFHVLRAELAKRVLVVAADLPLPIPLLEAFRKTGALSTNNHNDPYAPDSTGFLPGEGAAAFVLENVSPGRPTRARILGYWANSDAEEPIGAPADGAPLAELLEAACAGVPGPVRALSPHATGTLASARAESAALRRVFADRPPTLHLLKPFTGHALGASGALDTAILSDHLARGLLPPNLPSLTPPDSRFDLPDSARPIDPDGVVLKLSSGMGGRNAVIALASPAA
jgi:3-oxoacyl-[acyl-carrier-protein] synthase II